MNHGKKNSAMPCFKAIFRCLLLCMGVMLLSACVTSGGGPNRDGRSSGSTKQPSGINPHYKVGNAYKIAGQFYYPQEDKDYSEIGVASWYGPNFHNKPTANGELFDMNALTAAHRTLPLPSIVEVTHLGNGRKIRIRVNDRGPFSKDRIIDLSREAAQRLGMIERGTARVKVEYLREASLALALTRVNDRKGIRAIENSLKKSNRRNASAEGVNQLKPDDELTALITQSTNVSQNSPQTRLQEAGSQQAGSLARDQPAPIPNYGALPIIEAALPNSSLSKEVINRSNNGPALSFKYQIQVGAFIDPNRAERLSLLLSPSGPVFIQSELKPSGSPQESFGRANQNFYKVFMGPYQDQAQAQNTLMALHNAGYGEARLIETGSW